MKAKKILAGVLAGLMLLGTAGCASTGTSSAAQSGESASAESGKEVVVTIPSYKTGENTGAIFFEPQVERFNEKYEGKYQINLESVPENNFKDRLKQLGQQNKLPVLVQGGDVEWLKNIVFPNGMAYDLAPWLEEHPEIKDILIPEGLEYCTTEDGKIYSMPLATVRASGLYYNSAMWEPGDISMMSFDEFEQALGDQKIAFSTADNGWGSALFLTGLIANEEGGVELLNAGVDEKITDFNQAPFVNAVTKLQKYLQNSAASNSIGATFADAANSFMSEQAAVIANGPWMAAEFNESNSDKWSNNFDGANVRASLFPGNVGIATTRSYGEWWINASAPQEEIELALAFLEFIYTQEELEAFLLAEGGDAPQLEYSEEFKSKVGETQVLADLSEDTTADTVFMPCVLDVMIPSVASTEFGKLLPSLADGTYTPEQFCQWLTDKSAEASVE